MYVDSPAEAFDVLNETIARLSFARFPMRMTLRQIGGPPSESFWAGWAPRVIITMDIRDRLTGEPRQQQVTVPVYVHWEFTSRAELARLYALALYQSVRQAVLHEVAECCDYEGRLLDDPHDKYTHELRPEHEARFPGFRNGY